MSSLITLRRATVEDAPLIQTWRTEPSVGLFQPILSFTLDQVRYLLAERELVTIGPASSGKIQWIVETPNGPAGWLTLTIDADGRRHDNGDLGYTIAERFRGQGYASAAVDALLPIAFGRDHLALERLQAVAAVENQASRRVLERNGFHREGILRGLLVINGRRVDHATYGLLRTDWEMMEDGHAR